ncbi:MAG TPA: hydrolase Nlp/P60 [Eggerthellaceae bacterium]|nr:hydrolase Nlp/P60 [Eggerthellaceae bacterium]
MQVSSSVKTAGGVASIALGAALACSLIVPPANAYAVTSAEKAAEAQAALNELYAMQDTLQETSAHYYQSLADYAVAVEKCDAAQARIDEITGEITAIQARLGDRARDMYRHGASSFLDLLLGSTTFEEFSQSWDLLNRVNTTDADLSAQAKSLREEEEAQKAEYTEQAAVAETKSNEAYAAYQEAEVLVAQMEETYNSLSAEAAELYQQEQAAAAAAAAAAAQAAAQAAAAQSYDYTAYGDYGGYTEGGYTNNDGTVTDISTGQVYSSASEYSAATGNEIVDRAMSMLGHSYQYGATGANGSFDCSGLVGYAITGTYNRIGNTTTFMGYNQVSNPQPGDICVNAGHTGIYIGDGQMVHAADESTGVVVGNVQSGMIYVRP